MNEEPIVIDIGTISIAAGLEGPGEVHMKGPDGQKVILRNKHAVMWRMLADMCRGQARWLRLVAEEEQ
jgi:hypothetical protein